MERYQRGHQQPVEGRRPVGALLVFACVVVAVAVAVWGAKRRAAAASWGRLRFGLRFGGGVSKR